jgi:non-specific serine/threonine protein kinase
LFPPLSPEHHCSLPVDVPFTYEKGVVMIGTTVSHYKILEKLGEGGMGVVYKAHDTKLDRLVALKFLPQQFTVGDEDKARFLQEAKAISALNHPNIATIHDIDEVEGQKFLVLEYIPGGTLKSKLKYLKSEDKEFSLAEVLDYGIQAAEALGHAHRHQIIHRDVKTDNLMLTEEGMVKLTDFGLAKLRGSVQVTKTGTTVGTAAYMSPEQIRGEETDHRSDIFSLGVVLFELLTSHMPFRGEFETALSYSILNENPPAVKSLRKDAPASLEKIINRCLEKEKTKRYQSADDTVADLRKVQHEILRPINVQKKTKKLALIVGTGIIVIAMIVLAYFLVSHEEKPASRLKMIAVLPFENLGPAEDEYFADGLTDEITSRLSSISNLGVISRTSSIQYKKTSKTLPVVAKELGVDYILEGTIRWEKAGGTQRIRITPQLIKVSGDVHLWADNIDRTLDDIFAVQTEIATRVVTSLDIVLSENEKRDIELIPTKNLEAYQAYLRGLSFQDRLERPNVETAIEMFHRAVELDSTFALAYARLSMAHVQYFWLGFDATKERVSLAKQCLDRAFALQGELPEAYTALGYYYFHGYRNYDRALEAFAVAEKKLPNNSELLASDAWIWRRQGKLEQALERLKKAFELDPQSANLASNMGFTLLALGVYADAEVYYDRSISLLRDQSRAYREKADLYLLWHGDTKKSRSELERVPTQYYPWASLTWLDIYERNYESALDRLDHAPVSTSIGQRSVTPVSQLRGLIYRFMKDTVRSHASFDSARVFLESETKKRPDDFRLHQSLGIVYAGLGRTEEAVRESKLAVEQLPISLDAMDGVNLLISLARVYVMVGEYDAALDKLEYLISLHAPKSITAPILRLDPIYDPLRSNPRFQKLLARAR